MYFNENNWQDLNIFFYRIFTGFEVKVLFKIFLTLCVGTWKNTYKRVKTILYIVANTANRKWAICLLARVILYIYNTNKSFNSSWFIVRRFACRPGINNVYHWAHKNAVTARGRRGEKENTVKGCSWLWWIFTIENPADAQRS